MAEMTWADLNSASVGYQIELAGWATARSTKAGSIAAASSSLRISPAFSLPAKTLR
jgi:hypothetical protein